MYRLGRVGRAGRLLRALGVGGAVFGIATAVQADIPDSGTINGCYYTPGKLAPASPRKGTLRVIDTSKGQTCASDETALRWNAAGVTGSTGPTGPTGPTGAAGVGIGGSCSNNQAIQSVNADGSVNCVAFTPAGRVLATGWTTLNPGQDVTLFDEGDVKVTGTCTGGADAQVTIADDGGSGLSNVDGASDSSTEGHLSWTLLNGHSQLIADQLASPFGEDRVSFQAQGGGLFTLDGTASALSNSYVCLFEGSAIAADGPAPQAGQAPTRQQTPPGAK